MAFRSIPLALTSTVARSSEVCQLYRSGDVNASRRQPPAALEELINSQLKRTFGKHSEVAARLPVRALVFLFLSTSSLSLTLSLPFFFPSHSFLFFHTCALTFVRSYLRAQPRLSVARLRALIKIVKSVSSIRRD